MKKKDTYGELFNKDEISTVCWTLPFKFCPDISATQMFALVQDICSTRLWLLTERPRASLANFLENYTHYTYLHIIYTMCQNDAVLYFWINIFFWACLIFIQEFLVIITTLELNKNRALNNNLYFEIDWIFWMKILR